MRSDGMARPQLRMRVTALRFRLVLLHCSRRLSPSHSIRQEDNKQFLRNQRLLSLFFLGCLVSRETSACLPVCLVALPASTRQSLVELKTKKGTLYVDGGGRGPDNRRNNQGVIASPPERRKHGALFAAQRLPRYIGILSMSVSPGGPVSYPEPCLLACHCRKESSVGRSVGRSSYSRACCGFDGGQGRERLRVDVVFPWSATGRRHATSSVLRTYVRLKEKKIEPSAACCTLGTECDQVRPSRVSLLVLA
jgi:hypothetical protein